MKNLLTDIALNHKHILFKLHSNGTLMTKQMCKDMGIYDRIFSATISLHASSEETYNKIVKFGNFKKVLKNMEWLSKESKIKKTLIFVVENINYTEIPNLYFFGASIQFYSADNTFQNLVYKIRK